MKLGIMQPYFFPYIGYFILVNYADYFVFFDTSQYKKRSWMNRNRILNPSGGTTYITVPVEKMSQDTAIKDILIDHSKSWKADILGKLTIYKKKAPNYQHVVELVECLFGKEYDHLCELNIQSILLSCEYLGIQINHNRFSDMNLKIEDVRSPDEWALEITKCLSFDTYVNLPGGKAFFDKEKYERENIELQFIEAEVRPYIQKTGRFDYGLSIIDLMMFCGTDEISDMLKGYKLI